MKEYDDAREAAEEAEKARLEAIDWQGLTLVILSAQLEPCVPLKNTLHTINTP
jgi:hypothetical protein